MFIQKDIVSQIFMRLSENVIVHNDTNETHHNISLAREMSSILCRYRQAQFPPPLTWMNRVQQAFSSPIHYLANAIILFNSHHTELYYIKIIYKVYYGSE